MSRNWIAPRCRYLIDNGTIRTHGETVEKISGTSLGAILGKSPYETPFTISTKLLGVWGEDISDKPQVRAGIALEERIIEYQASRHPSLGTFLKAEDIFDPRAGDHSQWRSDFEDDVFSGHVDGIISKDGIDYILEVKTTSRRAIETYGTWVNGVPEHYLWQVYLYNHFITKQDRAYFLLGILEERDYANPYGWVPNKDNCRLFEVSIDREMVADKLAGVRKTYCDTIRRGISLPCTDDPRDQEVMTYLRDISGDSETLMALAEDFKTLKTANKFHLDLNKDNIEKEKELGERIKTIMTTWGMTECDGISVTCQRRKTIDFAKAEADGIDLTPYTTEKLIPTIKLKNNKD